LLGGRRSKSALVPDALWISADGGQLNSEAISKRIVKLTRRSGPSVSPHLFRSCAATTIAIDAPEAVHVVPAVLGHAGPEVSERYYNLAGSVDASRRYHAILAELDRRQAHDDHASR
jgi:integrase/recombinase XerD